MAEVILVTTSELNPRLEKIASFFKFLGMDVISFKDEEKFSLENYEVVFTEKSLYNDLKKLYPLKIIVPLVDLEKKEMVIFEKMKKLIREVVGENILR